MALKIRRLARSSKFGDDGAVTIVGQFIPKRFVNVDGAPLRVDKPLIGIDKSYFPRQTVDRGARAMHKTNRIVPAVVLGIAGIFTAASPSFGALITYTMEATASGSLDGISFTDATVVLMMKNNTANVTGGPSFFENVGTATVSVGGGTAVTFTDPIQVFSNQSVPAVGFEDLSLDDILDNLSASFASYDLKTSIGPIVGSSDFDPGSSFPTTGGAFELTSVGEIHLYLRDIGNSRALHLGDDADWLRRARVRGISQGKGCPRNSPRLVYQPSPGSRARP